jgi:hypothetical protein
MNREQCFLHDVLGFRVTPARARKTAPGNRPEHRGQGLEQPLIGGRVSCVGRTHPVGPFGFALLHARSCIEFVAAGRIVTPVDPDSRERERWDCEHIAVNA